MTDCLLKLDWESIYSEYCYHFNSRYDKGEYERDGSRFRILTSIIEKEINKTIEELVEKHTSNNNTIDIDYIKDQYRLGLDRLRTIKFIRKLTGCSLKEAKDLTDLWDKEI